MRGARLARVLLAVIFVLSPQWVGAASAEERCEARQWKAASKLLRNLAKCERKANGDEPARSACTDAAQQKFRAAMERISRADSCDADRVSVQIESIALGAVGSLGALTDPTTASTCCELDSFCHVTPPEHCIEIGGVPGTSGSVCSGTGRCEEPAIPGHCCQMALGTCLGGPITDRRCILIGGVLLENRVCSGERVCVEP